MSSEKESFDFSGQLSHKLLSPPNIKPPNLFSRSTTFPTMAKGQRQQSFSPCRMTLNELLKNEIQVPLPPPVLCSAPSPQVRGASRQRLAAIIDEALALVQDEEEICDVSPRHPVRDTFRQSTHRTRQ